MPPVPSALREFAIPGDLLVTVPDNPRLMTAFILEERGDWFENEIHFVRHRLRPGMAVVDIGANYGLYTLSCARRVGPEGRVWAYEPASLPRTCLDRSIVANQLPQVRLTGAAISNHCGTARLGIAANAELNRLDESSTQYETVPLTTIDSESARWDRPVDFMKIDAEGEEVRILDGAAQFFTRNDPLLMLEYHESQTDNLPLLTALERLGMSIYRFLPSLDALVPLALAPAQPCLLNIFACRAARAAKLAADGTLVESAAPAPSGGTVRLADWLTARPWRAVFPGLRSASANQALHTALEDTLNGEDPAIPADARLAYKQRALATLKALVDERASLPRLYSAARVAMDLAEQELSVAYLLEAACLIAAEPSVSNLIQEPFLPPDRRHDSLGGSGTAKQILSIMADEALLERTTFSVYFAGRKALPVLLRLAHNPLRSPASEQRLAAARRMLPV